MTLRVLSAVALAVATAQAGMLALPLDDEYKAVAIFVLSTVSVFLAGLVTPPRTT